MKKNALETKHLLISWYKFSRDMLFTGLQREKYWPVTILAPIEDQGRLQDERDKHQSAVDDLVCKVLEIEDFHERDKLLSRTDPLIVALYFDRIQSVTLILEETAKKAGCLSFDEPLNIFFLGVVRGMLLGKPLPLDA